MKDPNDTGRFIPPVVDGDHSWMSQPLPAGALLGEGADVLANAIYFEARGEDLRGQAAVAQVVLNRVRDPAYPKTICGVVYQNEHLKNRCRFSFRLRRQEDASRPEGSTRPTRMTHLLRRRVIGALRQEMLPPAAKSSAPPRPITTRYCTSSCFEERI